jgi:hypothetical protein
MKNLLNISRGTAIQGRARVRIIDAAMGKVCRDSGIIKNTVLDAGLNLFASGAIGYADFFATCKVGSGTTPIQIASGGITFTQVGTAVVCVAGTFFTPAMVGGLLKYGSGSGGVEQYITAVTGTPVSGVYPGCTVAGAGMTVAVGTAATVWQVQRAGLATYSYQSSTYGTATTPTVFSTNTLQLTRVFNFAVQSGSYNVNEVGYSSNVTADGTCSGFFVLGSTWVVAPTQFLQVTWTLTYTVSPGVPTAVGNVGTGVNTAGQAMLNYWDCQTLNSDGSVASAQGSYPSFLMDKTQNIFGGFVATGIGLPSNPLTTASATQTTLYQMGSGSIFVTVNAGSAAPSNVAVGGFTKSFTITSAAESCGGLIFGSQISGTQLKRIFAINFTAPITLPAGSFSGSFSLTNTFSRTLTN